VNDAVTVAYVHSNEVAHSWHMSLVEMFGWDLAHEGRIMRGGWLAMRCGTDGVPAGRNEAARRFLAEKDADWLFWVDTDMGFAPDTIDRLLEVADPVERPIVGGLCFAQRETSADGMGGYRCSPRVTIFDWVRGDNDVQGFQGRTVFPANSVVQCAGTGSACILIHRSVLERIAGEFGPAWYERAPNPSGGLYGEDLSFCIRAGALNIPIFVHTGVRTTHLKNLWLSDMDYWQSFISPPAMDQTAVIVPVMRRPANAAPFMASLRASTGLATVYAVADMNDRETANAWKEAGAVVLNIAGEGSGTFAEKVNIGYRESQAPWLFLVGDDVRFHPGWLDHAQTVAADRYHVIGTNDLGSTRVMNGEHATHLLVRRTYVDDQGASWDGPGVVAHEGYRHWFVDDEIVAAAKQRGVWAMALGSIVEHMHPLFGKAETDDVYELGQAQAETDRKTFKKRLRTHA